MYNPHVQIQFTHELNMFLKVEEEVAYNEKVINIQSSKFILTKQQVHCFKFLSAIFFIELLNTSQTKRLVRKETNFKKFKLTRFTFETRFRHFF